MHWIYRLTSPSGRSYIGATDNFNLRLSKHLGKPAASVGPTHIQRALCRYGVLSFSIDILEENIVDSSEARERESHWINTYNTVYPTGYNHGAGANHPCSRIVSAKISRRKTGHTHNLGTKYRKAGGAKNK